MVYCGQCGAANTNDVAYCFACHSPLSLDVAATSLPTMLHGRYRLLNQLGSGGYGAVYKALDMQAGEYPVALKIISLQGLKPQEVIDATDTFHRELQILSGLRHRSLPCLYEHFTDKDHWYLVMEFIEGETLEHVLLTQPLPLPLLDVCHIGIQLCAVLEYLHTREPAVIFRDLKPANVMITPFKQVYLIDFGTARLFKPGRSRDTIAFGSPGYAPPEQYGTAQTTPRSDIYSLGATLHQLLTGIDPSHDPFNFVPLVSRDPSLPVELSDLLERMLSLYPDERPASMNEIETALQDLSVEYARRLYPLPGTFSRPLRPATGPYVVPSQSFSVEDASPLVWPEDGTGGQVQVQQQEETVPVERTGLSRRMVIAGLLALAVGGVGVLGQRSSESARRRGFRRHHRHHRRYRRMETGLHQTAVTSLAWIVAPGFLASRSADGVLLVQDAFSGQAIASFAGPANEGITALAALHHFRSASLLAIGLNTHGFALWDVATNLFYQQKSGISFTAPVRALAWSFDDRRLAIAEGDLVHLFFYNHHTSEFLLERDLVGHDAPVTCLVWSPNGEWIASGSEDQTIRLWSTCDSAAALDATQVYRGHRGAILSVDWAQFNDPEFFYGIASCATDGQIQVWRALTVSPAADMPDDPATLVTLQNTQALAVAWAPGQSWLAYADQEDGVMLWDRMNPFNSAIALNAWSGAEPVTSVAWSPDGELLASGGSQGAVNIWYPQVSSCTSSSN